MTPGLCQAPLAGGVAVRAGRKGGREREGGRVGPGRGAPSSQPGRLPAAKSAWAGRPQCQPRVGARRSRRRVTPSPNESGSSLPPGESAADEPPPLSHQQGREAVRQAEVEPRLALPAAPQPPHSHSQGKKEAGAPGTGLGVAHSEPHARPNAFPAGQGGHPPPQEPQEREGRRRSCCSCCFFCL